MGFNPQESSVESEDFTGTPPPKTVKKLGRNNKKSNSYKMKPMGTTKATGRGLKPCKDSSNDFTDEPITL